MSSSKKVSVVIPSWNGLDHLKVCIEALLLQKNPGMEWEIIVFDNGSCDGTSEWLEKESARIKQISSNHNIGFAGAVNRLVKAADGEVVAILNNDTRPKPEWLSAIVDSIYSASSEVAAVSGMIIDWSGKKLDFATGCMAFDGHAFQQDFNRRIENSRVPESGEDLLFACGGNMIVRKEDFLEYGGFDEDYFAYYEDVDFGWRLWSAGKRVIFSPEAVVHHRSGATSDALGNYCRGSLFERNSFMTVYKNYEKDLWEKMMPAIMLTLISRTQHLLIDLNPGGDLIKRDPFAGSAKKLFRKQNAANMHLLLKTSDYFRRIINSVFMKLRYNKTCFKIEHEGTIAQLQVINFILGNIDNAAWKRKTIQEKRIRKDIEIFERFPLYLVPTYRGDEELFSSSGFQSWLPENLPLIRCRLDEMKNIGKQG
ncbi:MAG: glycosyltransferase family 2 protein [Candidatus Theseobacter exili]|nr:glycosyltransferase family 2 protein [Candidatus Theseobacter exili]